MRKNVNSPRNAESAPPVKGRPTMQISAATPVKGRPTTQIYAAAPVKGSPTMQTSAAAPVEGNPTMQISAAPTLVVPTAATPTPADLTTTVLTPAAPVPAMPVPAVAAPAVPTPNVPGPAAPVLIAHVPAVHNPITYTAANADEAAGIVPAAAVPAQEEAATPVSDKQPARHKGRPPKAPVSKELRNTHLLLTIYRSVEWAVTSNGDKVNQQLEEKCGQRLNKLRINAGLLGVDVSDLKLNGQIRALTLSEMMLEAIKKALLKVKTYPNDGERLYRILDVTYFRQPRPADKTVILSILAMEGDPMSRSEYYLLLKRAERVMDFALWGCFGKEIQELLLNGLDIDWSKLNF